MSAHVDVEGLFAGDGLAIPSGDEWRRADLILAEHGAPLIPRRRDSEAGRTIPCNRAWLRSRMRRSLRHTGATVTLATERTLALEALGAEPADPPTEGFIRRELPDPDFYAACNHCGYWVLHCQCDEVSS